MSATKTCAGCKRNLPLAAFHIKSGSQRHARCRDCRSIKVGREESVYRRDGNASFFSDIVRAEKDPAARERLSRHQAQTEKRDVVGTSGGGAAGLIPPGWLSDEYAAVARAPRPLADRIPSVPMPKYGDDFKVPRLTGGVSVAIQNPENAAVSEQDTTSDTVTFSVAEIVGQLDASRQSFDRSLPGVDFVVFSDLMKAVDAQLESQLITGSGSNGQIRGLRNVASTISVTYNQATPSQDQCMVAIAQAASKVATQRFVNELLVVAHPRRLAWLASASGTASLNDNPAFADYGFNVEFVADPSVPTNLGASTNADEIYVVHPGSFFLAEDDVRLEARDVLSGNLTVRMQALRYVLAGLSLYPAAIGIVSGTGLVPNSGY